MQNSPIDDPRPGNDGGSPLVRNHPYDNVGRPTMHGTPTLMSSGLHHRSVATRAVLPAGIATLVYFAAAAPTVVTDAASWSATHVGVAVLLGFVLIALSTIDWLAYRLPDALTLPLVVAGLVLHASELGAAFLDHLTAAAVAFLGLAGVAWLYEKLRGRSGIGLGDAKLYAAAGAWLGLAGLPSVMLYATVAALVAVTLAALAGRTPTLRTRVPFGPFLAFAIWLVWLYGPIGFADDFGL